ncbi:MAG: N-acetylmuramoyl-L-alanine amidase, partial [Bacteroidales bacterium]|nr:N-acetylmuramoyl-L-alanine amidase [Bacteroidales bacterium]
MNLRRAVLLLATLAILGAAHAQSTTDLRLNTIVIDPGHGGKDPGCVSQDKRTQEKDLTLAISQKLAQKIRKKYPEMKVLLTREKDVFVALRDRAQFATKNNANLFISVHINAATNRSANGFAAYILGQSSNKNTDTYAFNMDVVTRENSVIYLEDDTTVYGDLNDNSPEAQIMSQFLYNAFREQSLGFAETVNNRMKAPFKHSYGVQQANFQVLREASMPAVLLELGFISNTSDLSLLRSDKSLDQMAENVYQAFVEYKTSYDASVTITPGASRPAPAQPAQAQPAPAPKEEPAPQPQAAPAAEELYGVQVLASSRLMKDNDPYFLGYEVTRIQTGNLYKYIIGVSNDLSEARRVYSIIRQKYKDAFLVVV